MLDQVITLIRELATDGELPKDLTTAPLGRSTTVEGLGLDSLGTMNLLAALDERIGIYIAGDQLSPEMTLGALAERLAK